MSSSSVDPKVDPKIARRALELLADSLDVRETLKVLPELSADELQRILRKAAAGAGKWKAGAPAKRGRSDGNAAPRAGSAGTPSSLRQPASASETYTMYTDGASRGNPGPAGVGMVIYDAAGEVVQERWRYLGAATNNVAEYQALIDGMALARELKIKRLRVRSDSELLCHQMNGVYRVKNPGLRPLFEEAKDAAAKFSSFSVEHVRREGNRHADELANRGIDRR